MYVCIYVYIFISSKGGKEEEMKKYQNKLGPLGPFFVQKRNKNSVQQQLLLLPP